MPRKRPGRATFAEIVADVQSSPKRARAPQVRASNANPVTTGQLMFGGRSWWKQGAELHLRTALDLADAADLVLVAEGGGYVISSINDRSAAAEMLKKRFGGPDGRVSGPSWPDEPVYRAYRFDNDDHQTLLYLDKDC